ncbi:hypothetical protein CHUAL_010901 [Chamberlinius hualienensis]
MKDLMLLRLFSAVAVVAFVYQIPIGHCQQMDVQMTADKLRQIPSWMRSDMPTEVNSIPKFYCLDCNSQERPIAPSLKDENKRGFWDKRGLTLVAADDGKQQGRLVLPLRHFHQGYQSFDRI